LARQTLAARPLALASPKDDLGVMKANRTTSSRAAAPDPTLATRRDLTPNIFIAPELLGHEHELTVIRNDDDSDEDYKRSCELLALVIEAARKP
jgi:hypothetical protein